MKSHAQMSLAWFLRKVASLARLPAYLGHVLWNGTLADLDVQLQQLTANALRTPQVVFLGHLPDESDRFRGDTRLAVLLP